MVKLEGNTLVDISLLQPPKGWGWGSQSVTPVTPAFAGTSVGTQTFYPSAFSLPQSN